MKIKTTLRYTSHLLEWLLSKKMKDKSWPGYGKKGTLVYYW
jgi:hypothetical protein